MLSSYDSPEEELQAAAIYGAVDRADRLLMTGADPNGRDKEGHTPLHLAANNKNNQLVELLVKHKANVNTVGRQKGRSPLWYACRHNCTSSISVLLSAGGHVNLQDLDGMSALHIAVKHVHTEAVEQLLAHREVDVNLENKFGQTPLHEAAKIGNTAIVGMLLFQAANPNAVDRWLNTPLMYAALHNHKNTVAFLLQANCDVNKVNKGLRTALHTACRNGHGDVVGLLISAGAQLDLADSESNTPVLLAGRYQYSTIMRALIEAGCDVHHRDMSNKTLFHFAALSGNQELVQRLLSLNAHPDLADENDNTPLMLAIRRNHIPIVRALLLRNCDIHRCLHSAGVAWDPLALAIKHGYPQLAAMMVRAGCSGEAFRALVGTNRMSPEISGDPYLMSWLDAVTRNPGRLRQLCRIAVRKALSCDIQKEVHQLTLPHTLKEYLLLDDLDRGCVPDL